MWYPWPWSAIWEISRALSRWALHLSMAVAKSEKLDIPKVHDGGSVLGTCGKSNLSFLKLKAYASSWNVKIGEFLKYKDISDIQWHTVTRCDEEIALFDFANSEMSIEIYQSIDRRPGLEQLPCFPWWKQQTSHDAARPANKSVAPMLLFKPNKALS